MTQDRPSYKKDLAAILKKAQGRVDAESGERIHVGDEVARLRDTLDRLSKSAKASEAARQEGDVVVTRDGVGTIVAVTRQDSEGRVLSVIAEQERTCRWRRLYGCDTPKNHVLYTDGHGEDHEFYQRRPETCGDCGGKIVEGD